MFDAGWRWWDYLWFIGVPLLFIVVTVLVFLPRYKRRFRDA